MTDLRNLRWHDLAKAYLGSAPLFGKLLRQHGEPAMIDATIATLKKQPADQTEFFIGCLRGGGNGHRKWGEMTGPERLELCQQNGVATAGRADYDLRSRLLAKGVTV